MALGLLSCLHTCPSTRRVFPKHRDVRLCVHFLSVLRRAHGREEDLTEHTLNSHLQLLSQVSDGKLCQQP